MTTTLEDCQRRWINDPLNGENGQNYAAEYRFMLNTIFRLQDELEEYKEEQHSLVQALKTAKMDLEAERHNHKVTLDLFEKALQELVSWREAARK